MDAAPVLFCMWLSARPTALFDYEGSVRMPDDTFSGPRRGRWNDSDPNDQ